MNDTPWVNSSIDTIQHYKSLNTYSRTVKLNNKTYMISYYTMLQITQSFMRGLIHNYSHNQAKDNSGHCHAS